MFVQAEAAQRAFRCVIIKRDFTVTKEYFSCLFLVDAVVDPFQSFTLGQATGSLDFFCPHKESLHQRFEIDLPLLFPVIRFQISELGVQMVYGANPLGRLVSDRIFGCLMILFRQCLQGIGKIPSRMGPAPCENDGLTFLSGIPADGLLSGSSGIHTG